MLRDRWDDRLGSVNDRTVSSALLLFGVLI